ncbi:hypothetical protein CWR45_02435 [Oceanobacillus chungangensis]|uniref:Uncharacterized protein n=1 Tax=Oceanobacillus chungangensis TaxID=1229152 RepID=A0A3D8Q135_9BACI|nr:hypothetical protein CWR45_02435 [Oceanobacillus chungangensis]
MKIKTNFIVRCNAVEVFLVLRESTWLRFAVYIDYFLCPHAQSGKTTELIDGPVAAVQSFFAFIKKN